jgi:hypothetical protein
MKPSNLNRLREFYCVLFGHEFNEHGIESEGDFILEERVTCSNCRLSAIDISGRIQRYNEKYNQSPKEI